MSNKNTKILIITLITNILFASCNFWNLSKLLQKNYTTNANYLVELEMDRTLGLIIIPITIKGKKYRFLWDTGAIMVISKELREELNLKKKTSQNIRDSRGTYEKLEFVELDKLEIGNVPFYHVGIAVADLNKSVMLSCLKMDGIIGGNLMNKSFWQIDFKNNKLRMASTIDTFNLDSNSNKVPFKTKNNGTPVVQVLLNDTIISHLTFDTGFVGHLSLGKNHIKGKVDSTNYMKYPMYGYNSSGLYGSTFNTIYKSRQKIGLDSNSMIDALVTVKQKKSKGLLGLDYLENFLVTLDWKTQRIYFEKFQTKPKELYFRNINPFYFNNKFVIGSYLLNDSTLKNILPNDTIVKMNNKYMGIMAATDFCNYVYQYKLMKDTLTLILGNNRKVNSVKLRLK